jgi:hypothetical protein
VSGLAQPRSVLADDERDPRTIGISASLQSGQPDLHLPIWASPTVVIAPTVSYMRQTDQKTDLGIGIALRLYVRQGKTMPYIGGRFVFYSLEVEGGEKQRDYQFGPAAGGEYFFSDYFSVGVEGQLNITISDEGSMRVGNPDGTTFNTASAVSATFYF